MKVLGIVLAVVAVAALGLFLWPLFRKPAPAPGTGRAAYSRQPVRVVAARAPAARPPAADSSPTLLEAAAAAAADHAAAPQGPLCDRSYSAADAPAFELPPGRLMRAGRDPAPGAWTWISLWAAWCKPCKEEMPLLARWAAEARAGEPRVRLLFPSVDDDERELRRFLQGRGRDLPGRFTWIETEAARERLYTALGVSNPPTLPLQAVLDDRGRLRCVRVGSISKADLARAPAALGWGGP